MKTFETEKHNIPEGATHYLNETDTDYFAWFKGVESGDFAVMVTGTSHWVCGPRSYYLDLIKSIPQTKEVEWVNGLPPVGAIYTVDPNHNIELLCKYSSKYVVIGEMLPKETYNGMEVVINTMEQRDRTFRKPETQEDREKREELESAYDLYESAQHAINCIGYDDFELFKKSKVQCDFWLSIVRKTGYRKGGE